VRTAALFLHSRQTHNAILGVMSVSMTATTERLLLGFLALLGIAGSLILAVATDRPPHLPGVALGSVAVLCVERAIACFTAYLLVLVVVARAFAGELPSELRGVRYESSSRDGWRDDELQRLTAAERALRKRIDQIERVVATNVRQ
jgi:hypothetical protein